MVREVNPAWLNRRFTDLPNSRFDSGRGQGSRRQRLAERALIETFLERTRRFQRLTLESVARLDAPADESLSGLAGRALDLLGVVGG